MKVLHVLRSPRDKRALVTARVHARDHETTLLLLQDAATAEVLDFPGVVYACLDEAAPREGIQHQQVSYAEVVSLVFEHDRVIVW